MAREECSHPLNRGKTDAAPASQVTSSRHSATNALLSSFLRGQATFTMLLS
jgi:hypothetical protein